MDLMRLLKAKNEHLLAGKSVGDGVAARIISDLKIQFETFLKDVAQLDEFRKHNPLEGVKCIDGEVLLEDQYGILGKSPYLFLRIPGHPGLLMEIGESGSLLLFAATEARPIQRQWNGEQSSQVVFVRRPTPISSFVILEPDTVRDESTAQTFVGTRFFEHLVEKLIVHINPPSSRK